MRRLSVNQAFNCETAQGHTCRCRCGGVLHGAKRFSGNRQTAAEFFNELPVDDPHYRPLTERERDTLKQLELFTEGV